MRRPRTILWRAGARDDLLAILAAVAARDVRLAKRLLEIIDAVMESLKVHSLLYREGRVTGTAEMVVHPNYVMAYRMSRNVVEVLALAHARRMVPGAEG